MSGLRHVITINSSDPRSELKPPAGSSVVSAASFEQNLGMPLVLDDSPDQYEVALASLEVAGLDPSLTGCMLVMSDICDARSRLGSEQRAFLQTVPLTVTGTGTLSYVNEASDMVQWRPASKKIYSTIDLLLQQDNTGQQLNPCVNVIASFMIRHVSLR